MKGSTNRKFSNFANAIFCYAENDIIRDKEFALRGSPKFFVSQKTFLIPNIKLNRGFVLQVRQS